MYFKRSAFFGLLLARMLLRPSAALLARLATLPQLSLPPAPARRYGPPLRACATASPPPFTPTDEKWMQLALEEAAAAFAKGEVPIGAVLVHNGVAIARAHNLVEHTQDASAHAEMLCLRAAAAQLDSWRLLNSTLYCTVEPCPMCLAAANGFRVSRLVYGTTNARLGMPTLFPPTHNPPTHPPPPPPPPSSFHLGSASSDEFATFSSHDGLNFGLICVYVCVFRLNLHSISADDPATHCSAAGAVESTLRAPPNPIHTSEPLGGLLAEEASQLMKDFFRQRRLTPKSEPRVEAGKKIRSTPAGGMMGEVRLVGWRARLASWARRRLGEDREDQVSNVS